ncbi:cobinamide kinase/cobinamide phosphate guanyltransferase [Oceanicola granulosus HTCC2516]|uniref:Adenosylcobinamide kinase n=2 Tax=Oceanicola granulosus TaxID=252302 RepID=Q2CI99_OCEGH|nr:cobinamide kinase/cobinamide phosphate guanyltransferase [Oceanicola granulosus HTCC2516]
MTGKIAAHRAARGEGWETLEVPLDIAPALAAVSAEKMVILDCATLWLTNLQLSGADPAGAPERFVAALEGCAAPVVVVSNEVGQGIVPMHEMSRAFREAQGRLNQAVAARAGLVVAVMAGLPLVLKGAL